MTRTNTSTVPTASPIRRTGERASRSPTTGSTTVGRALRAAARNGVPQPAHVAVRQVVGRPAGGARPAARRRVHRHGAGASAAAARPRHRRPGPRGGRPQRVAGRRRGRPPGRSTGCTRERRPHGRRAPRAARARRGRLCHVAVIGSRAPALNRGRRPQRPAGVRQGRGGCRRVGSRGLSRRARGAHVQEFSTPAAVTVDRRAALTDALEQGPPGRPTACCSPARPGSGGRRHRQGVRHARCGPWPRAWSPAACRPATASRS